MKIIALFVAALVVLVSAPANAETRRIAVLVGHNAGSDGQQALRWAEDDAGKLADVLVQLGDVRPADLFLVQGKGVARVKDAIVTATAAVRAARHAPDDRVVVYFYYSGHSDGSVIELGGERLSFLELKTLLAGTGADVRVMIVDACKSGTLVAKGGHPGPAFSVDLVDDLTTHGEAMLTSSAADEQSLESSEIRGSFFTHHFVSGLRGAADSSGDGRVTLSEAYEYAFGKTVTASAATGATPQHPSYDYRLSGRGELVLTDVASRTSILELPAGFDRALVVALQRDQIVAEITTGGARRVALAPGTYAVRLWRKGTVVAGRIAVTDGAVATVRWDDLQPIDATKPATKGEAIAAKSDGDELAPAAQADFDKNMLSFGEDTTIVVNGNTAQMNTDYAVYLGKYRTKIDLDDFYTRVERPDLADRYRSRRDLKRGLMIGGGVVVAASLVYAFAERCDMPDVGDPNFSKCLHDNGNLMKVSVGGAIVGGLVFIIGGGMPNQPVKADEMRALTDQYNTGLRTRLRAPNDAAPGATAHLAPYASPGGGGALLSGTF